MLIWSILTILGFTAFFGALVYMFSSHTVLGSFGIGFMITAAMVVIDAITSPWTRLTK